jgi:hypothetical protein
MNAMAKDYYQKKSQTSEIKNVIQKLKNSSKKIDSLSDEDKTGLIEEYSLQEKCSDSNKKFKKALGNKIEKLKKAKEKIGNQMAEIKVKHREKKMEFLGGIIDFLVDNRFSKLAFTPLQDAEDAHFNALLLALLVNLDIIELDLSKVVLTEAQARVFYGIIYNPHVKKISLAFENYQAMGFLLGCLFNPASCVYSQLEGVALHINNASYSMDKHKFHYIRAVFSFLIKKQTVGAGKEKLVPGLNSGQHEDYAYNLQTAADKKLVEFTPLQAYSVFIFLDQLYDQAGKEQLVEPNNPVLIDFLFKEIIQDIGTVERCIGTAMQSPDLTVKLRDLASTLSSSSTLAVAGKSVDSADVFDTIKKDLSQAGAHVQAALDKIAQVTSRVKTSSSTWLHGKTDELFSSWNKSFAKKASDQKAVSDDDTSLDFSMIIDERSVSRAQSDVDTESKSDQSESQQKSKAAAKKGISRFGNIPLFPTFIPKQSCLFIPPAKKIASAMNGK